MIKSRRENEHLVLFLFLLVSRGIIVIFLLFLVIVVEYNSLQYNYSFPFLLPDSSLELCTSQSSHVEWLFMYAYSLSISRSLSLPSFHSTMMFLILNWICPFFSLPIVIPHLWIIDTQNEKAKCDIHLFASLIKIVKLFTFSLHSRIESEWGRKDPWHPFIITKSNGSPPGRWLQKQNKRMTQHRGDSCELEN